MRKHYIDNLRIICILLLFPFHAAMCFNSFGEQFYITGSPSAALSQIIVTVYPWWMSLLFAIAGMSSAYALKKRTAKEYAQERVLRLLVPIVSGLVLIVPPQAYYADVFHNGYSGGYFEHYIKFFTNVTDLYGSDGCFTPAQLWFALYLFVISLVCLPLMRWYSKRENRPDFSRISFPLLLTGGFLLLVLSSFVLDIGGKSVGEFCVCFLIGFFVLSDGAMQEKLQKNAAWLGAAWAVLMLTRSLMSCFALPDDSVLWGLEYRALELFGILGAIGLGGRFLNFENRLTRYFSAAAFPLYLFHQTILVMCAYYIVRVVPSTGLQYLSIVLSSFVLSVGAYEICRRFAAARFLFGMKSRR